MTPKLLIADTSGDGAYMVEAYRKRFPGIGWHFHGPVKDNRPHPHFGLCASRAALPLLGMSPAPEIHLYGHLAGTLQDVLIEKILEIKPNVVSCSWGVQVHLGQEPSDARNPWMEKMEAACAEVNARLLFAAGNTNYAGINDVAWPQRAMKNVIIVGATTGTRKSNEKPASFTADDKKNRIRNALLGVFVGLVNPLTGKTEKGSGTSYSCPGEAGLLLWAIFEYGLDTYEKCIAWLDSVVYRRNGYTFPHPQFGRGSMQPRFDQRCKSNRAFQLTAMPATLEALALMPLRWFDMIDLSDDENITEGTLQ